MDSNRVQPNFGLVVQRRHVVVEVATANYTPKGAPTLPVTGVGGVDRGSVRHLPGGMGLAPGDVGVH